ncbi:MAG TPA: FAD-binding oxidoreductase [Caulobacteraceae bacterium]|jgi:FAD/FMN-containing dehydrogenase
MKRRELLGAGLAMAGAAAFPVPTAGAAGVSRARPGGPGWPDADTWAKLGEAVGGRLGPVTAPDLSGPDAHKLLANPFYIADQPALAESSGWLDAWRAAPSAYAVTAKSATDVAAAVRFAGVHNLRLVIKGRGHSYLGGSSAPDSLLLWTRHMDDVAVHDAFTPQGSGAAPVPAVSCGAGAMWLRAYQAVSVGAGRYVQGGGCTTVGVAGLVQGGGFGSFSKAFGLAGAHLLEAEIVTADGALRTVNHVREPELFWALKGGGGGTFGAVTRLTLATHPLPQTFGALNLTLHARSDEAYRRLVARFLDLYAASLFGPHFGEQVRFSPDNRLQLSMVFQGITADAARAAIQPLIAFADAGGADYEGQKSLFVAALPARRFWDASLVTQIGAAVKDQRPAASPNDFWWTGDGSQVGVFWHGYASAWLPRSLLQPQGQGRLADALFAASRHQGVSLHFNKGLAGALPEALAASRDTPMNPDVLDAFALAITGDAGPTLFTGAAPDLAAARAGRERVRAAIQALRAAAPDTGAYVNECDYFQPDWQRAFWGPHYARLLAVKRRYDPAGLFTVHHGVGSEGWSADGFVRG